jgi:prepilin-type N-terminal cleavage/methylation domain-containing protein
MAAPLRTRVLDQNGFSLPELAVATTILLMISSAVTTALLQMTNQQKTIWNRTQMHGGVRSATELLQQEVGQAGRISFPGTVTLTNAVAAGAQTVAVSSTSNMFVGEQLTIDAGVNRETVTLTAVNTAANQITATFGVAHAAGSRIVVLGGFPNGIIPPGVANGSSATVLKLYGDINGDGNMVYVEYTCDTVNGFLYRNMMPYNAAVKPAVTNAQVLLDRIMPNPGGTACFTYMPNPLPVVNGTTYVLDVAITLTVQTQLKDPVTNQYQAETKALLNVSPRNVFDVWQLASAGNTNRVQPTPATIQALLP